MPYPTPSALRLVSTFTTFGTLIRIDCSFRKQVEHLEAERELMENQTKVLRARLEQTKYVDVTLVNSRLTRNQTGRPTCQEDRQNAPLPSGKCRCNKVVR